MLRLAFTRPRTPIGLYKLPKFTRNLHSAMADVEALKASLSSASAAFNTLKAQNADKSLVQEAQAKVIDLNKQIAALTKGAKGDGKKGRLTLKTPKVSRAYSTSFGDHL